MKPGDLHRMKHNVCQNSKKYEMFITDYRSNPDKYINSDDDSCDSSDNDE